MLYKEKVLDSMHYSFLCRLGERVFKRVFGTALHSVLSNQDSSDVSRSFVGLVYIFHGNRTTS